MQGKEPLRQRITRISDLQGSKVISWTQTDDAMPMPIDMRDPLVALTAGCARRELRVPLKRILRHYELAPE